MKQTLKILAIATLIPVAAAGASPARTVTACGLKATCNVENLGNERYRVTYVLNNVGTSSDVFFKWRISSPGVSSDWAAVQFNAPTGWNGSFNGGHLDFDTPNGSGGTQRLYSPSVAHCGGLTTLTFSWTFDREDGPVPDCSTLTGDDFTVHTQAINSTSCENVGTSFICTNVVPTEPVTWGTIKARFRD